MSRYQSIREECCEANLRLSTSGLVDLTFGNVSVLDPEMGVFAIKPSGVPYERLTPAMMVVLDMEGHIVEGGLRPSSDSPTHRRLFLGFPGIRSVVHTHSRNAVAFAQAAKEIPLLGTTHADYFRSSIPVTRALSMTEIEMAYEWKTGEVIVERFAGLSPLDTPAVLVRHHGPFVWGTSGEGAVETALALEIIAHMAMLSLSLIPSAAGPEPCLVNKHFFRKHGTSAYYGQSDGA